MKQYPKVARHDLPFVPDALLGADDLHLLEKMDGSNFRFMLYEERFADEYSDVVHRQHPSDGDIVFGTKTVVRGCVDEPVEAFEGDLQPGVLALRGIDKAAIRAAHDEHGPLVWFAEHMIPHTLDYDYDSNPPPALIGFDVYAPRSDDRNTLPENPYKERHIGYLDIGEARELFDSIGLPFTTIVKEPEDIRGTFAPEEFTVPQSAYGDVQAEGVVLRSDSLEVRAKLVTESFRELNKKTFGEQPAKADDAVQWIVDALITPARVRKHARRLVKEEGCEFSMEDEFIETLTKTVLADGWKEEFAEIANLDESFAPADAYEPAYERVRNFVERMEQMAARTDSDPTTTFTLIDKEEEVAAAPQPAQPDVAAVDKAIGQRADGASSERALFDELVGGLDQVDTELDRLVDKEGRELAGWAVEPAVDRLMDIFWSSDTSRSVLWRLHVEFNPSAVRPTVRELVRDRIEERADVDLDAGGKSWDPTQEEADAKSLGEFF